MRTTDVQAILRLVGGAAELWYEPSLQRQFTLDSLCRMLDAKVGICFTMGDVLIGGMTPCKDFTQVGLDEMGVMLFEEYLRSGKPRDPVIDVLSAIEVVSPPSRAAKRSPMKTGIARATTSSSASRFVSARRFTSKSWHNRLSERQS
jgi:hypothetical protein